MINICHDLLRFVLSTIGTTFKEIWQNVKHLGLFFASLMGDFDGDNDP